MHCGKQMGIYKGPQAFSLEKVKDVKYAKRDWVD